jgi:tetratricopeptide (TPR) repeat protein
MTGRAPRARTVRDVRWRTLVLTALVIAAGGIVIAAVSGDGAFSRVFSAASAPSGGQSPTTDPARQEIHQRFQQGVIMLHSKQHEHAMTAFHRVLELDPALPEAHVNMGFALIGLERYSAARDFFEGAITLRKGQVNAYYGLAVALDGLGDRGGAIGAMRTFVHLSGPDEMYLRKAQAALWEWEAERAAARPAQTR